MAIHQLNIDDFLNQADYYPVLDVRSPAEFAHAHIPNAHSFPIFSNEERAEIGTAYKQCSREAAIKIGFKAFGSRLNDYVEAAEKIGSGNDKEILVHCWRGGMRSNAMAWLLDFYGFKVGLLEGGYKSYRNAVLKSFEKSYPFLVLGGKTGSGKTGILKELAKKGYAVLDLEDLACHKGSAFGDIPGRKQPGQEQFENKLHQTLRKLTKEPPQTIFVEDESQRIGQVNLPGSLYQSIRNGHQLYLDIPFAARLEYILQDYATVPTAELIAAILRIKKRLGPLESKTAINFLLEDDKQACFDILLQYYDKQYTKSLANRAIHLDTVTLSTVHIETNSNHILGRLAQQS